MIYLQKTLANEYTFNGRGIHTGQRSNVTLKPAGPNHGIVFYKKSSTLPCKIPFNIDNVLDSNNATTIGINDMYIRTIEHLMSIIYGLGIDNLDIIVEGEEIPILDGSALEFWIGINYAGLEFFKEEQNPIIIKEPLEVRDGKSFIRVSPHKHLSVRCGIDFPSSIIGNQNILLDPLDDRNYITHIMSAKTFGFMKDYDHLLEQGLAQGSTPQNTIIIGDPEIINPNQMWHDDDFVRHKVLDLMGDLSLLNRPLCGAIDAYRPGHALNHKLVKKILDIY